MPNLASLLKNEIARVARKQVRAETAHHVHQYVANSETVAARIRYFYGRDATVIQPPVDTDFFAPGPTDPATPDYDLASRSTLRDQVIWRMPRAWP